MAITPKDAADVAALLRRRRQRYADRPQRPPIRYYAVDRDGNRVAPDSPQADRYDAVGALLAEATIEVRRNALLIDLTRQTLDRLAQERGYAGMVALNNGPDANPNLARAVYDDAVSHYDAFPAAP